MASYGTLPHAPEVCHALRSGVVREALSHPYLLHELLAFAGFHLASLNPNDRHRYSLRAFHHQKMAAGKMREDIAIMNSTNCHALFLTSIFLIVNAFAEPFDCTITGNTFSPTKAVVDIFSLVAGIKLIFHSSGLDLGSSPLNVLFIGPGSNKCDPYRLQSLLEQLPELRSRTYEAKGIEETQKKVLIASIEALQSCIDTVSTAKFFPPEEDVEVPILAQFADYLSPKVRAVTVDDEGLIVEVSADPEQDDTGFIGYLPFTATKSLHDCRTVHYSKLQEPDRLGPGVEEMSKYE
ncbi:hypothetical protein FOZG_16453 [Fusarium oxysporum Fo47]|uniref:Uncharacterized protein n=1 Tax=Fusarium oxysporum Fo47 TaxID=660027 RepID=W9JLP8_FUSOX|nr:hypothetical protein FOZG_16453 [Fusarium oxysporum Fo47]